LNCSLGATLFDPYAGSVSGESLLSIADEALYEAKAAGRNRLVFKEAVAPEPVPNRSFKHGPSELRFGQVWKAKADTYFVI